MWMFKFFHLYIFNNQSWLDWLMYDHHLSYITKFGRKKKKKPIVDGKVMVM